MVSTWMSLVEREKASENLMVRKRWSFEGLLEVGQSLELHFNFWFSFNSQHRELHLTRVETMW
jgi:hypothetical protein